MLKYDAAHIYYNIRRIKPYKLDTKVEGFNSKNMLDNVNICECTWYDRYDQLYTCVLIIKAWIKMILSDTHWVIERRLKHIFYV